MANSLYPHIEPFYQGTLQVSQLHNMYYEQVGNPQGQAALFLHGGPGLGILPIYRRFFDPEHYHIVLPDQRGAGRSTPYAELEDNDTWQIVEDLEKLRQHLNINQWLIMGGSWGSLLALCYAIKYPQNVSGLILRGLFLGRPKDIDWVYSGTGTAHLFPEQWSAFKAHLSNLSGSDVEESIIEDHQVVSAYYKLLTCDDMNIAEEAAMSWANYGAQTMTLLPNSPSSRDITNKNKMLALARTECHFSKHKFFMASDNFILENKNIIKDIPTQIVHGRYDVICAVSGAWELHKALPDSHLHIIADGAHIPTEAGMVDKLIEVSDRFKS